MKKYLKFLAVPGFVIAILGAAWNAPVWASSTDSLSQPSADFQPLSEITITESGSYTVGGLCQLNVVYTHTGASVKAAIDVPASESRKVPYSYDDELYLAGCHIVHYTKGEVTPEISPAYGSWEVCFGDRPDMQLTVYYYADQPESGSAVWLPLTTTLKDGFACAPANFSGVYAPGGRRITTAGGPGSDDGVVTTDTAGGTVRPPSADLTVTESGAYAVGGVCTMIVDYKVPNLATGIHVEGNVEISANVPYPDNEGLLYLPGCHVFHYKESKLVTDVTPDEGDWKICFAAIPNKETTIYFYYANDDAPKSAKPDWAPLETTVENGMACAPLTDHTGVYAPTGK
ncbi:MAG: hypothetical protein K8S20_02865 [Chloroflexi bacterium]|nr:hypothetical protein [Chloroflexota bacterium]